MYEAERQEDLQARDDGIADWHRECAVNDPPDHCVDWCAWRDCFGFCTNREKWPDCELMKQINP
jgi:hypothetical protein